MLKALDGNGGVIISSEGSSNCPYLQVKDFNGNILMNITKYNFYLESAGKNFKLDFTTNELTAQQFTLNAISKIGGSDALSNGIYLSSFGSTEAPYLKVVNNNNNLLYVDNKNFILQSHDWSEENRSGT
jgi:hypothetical protein